jgi:hypothetical protein
METPRTLTERGGARHPHLHAATMAKGPHNTKISSEGRHRGYPDLVCCILLLDGPLFM